MKRLTVTTESLTELASFLQELFNGKGGEDKVRFLLIAYETGQKPGRDFEMKTIGNGMIDEALPALQQIVEAYGEKSKPPGGLH